MKSKVNLAIHTEVGTEESCQHCQTQTTGRYRYKTNDVEFIVPLCIECYSVAPKRTEVEKNDV